MRRTIVACAALLGACDSSVPTALTETIASPSSKAPEAATPTVLEYFELDELTTAQRGRRVKVHGYVAKASVERKLDTESYRFGLARRGAKLAVEYTGSLPQDFSEQGEVVATGVLDASGASLAADEVISKCPDDYEEFKRAAP